jgi:hypothetical protein
MPLKMENARTFVSARLKSLLKHKPKLGLSVRFMAVVESTHRSVILARTNALEAKFKVQVEPLLAIGTKHGDLAQLIAEPPERIRTIQRVTVWRQALTIRRYQDAKIDQLCKINVLGEKTRGARK